MHWAKRAQRVTFFAARPGQVLSNIYLGGYDPSNFDTVKMCSVPLPSVATPEGQAGEKKENASQNEENPKGKGSDGGGILLGVVRGEVDLLMDPGDGSSKPMTKPLSVSNRTVLAPLGEAHSVRVTSLAKNWGSLRDMQDRNALTIWYYVHACPHGLFHLSIGFLSGAGWEQLYSPGSGTRKGWLMEYGIQRK